MTRTRQKKRSPFANGTRPSVAPWTLGGAVNPRWLAEQASRGTLSTGGVSLEAMDHTMRSVGRTLCRPKGWEQLELPLVYRIARSALEDK